MASNDVMIRLMADMSNLQSGLNKAQAELNKLKGTTEQATSGMSKAFKGIGAVMAGAFAVDKVKDFMGSMVEASASVNALDSMFTQTFKGDQQKAMAGITAQAKEQNINVDRLKGSWASMYGTFKGGGADANQSLELTTRYMQLAGDGSAYYDKSLDDVVSRLKSVTMGNFEAGDAIGLNFNATMLGSKATEQYGKKWQDLNQTQKEYLVLGVAEEVYKNTGAMGQGARESQSWLNVTENLKATWERFLGVIGQPVLDFAIGRVVNMTNVISGAITWVKSFGDAFNSCYDATGNFAEALAGAFDSMNMSWAGDLVMGIDSVIQKIQEVIGWFKEHELVTQALIGVIGGLVLAYAGFKTAMAITNGLKAMNDAIEIATIKMMLFGDKIAGASLKMTLASAKTLLWNTVCGIGTAVTTAFGTAMAILTSPITLVIGAIVALVAVGYLLIKNWDSVKAFLTSCWNTICTVASSVWNSICTAISGFMAQVSAVISSIWNGIKDFISGVMSAIGSFIMSVWNGICAGVSAVMSVISSVITAVWNGIQVAIAFVLNLILAIVVSVWNLVVSAISIPLNIIYNLVMMVWNSIKDTVMGVLNTILGVVTTVWNNICSSISTVLGVISSVVSTAWTGIQNVISIVVNAILGVVTTIWTGIRDFTSMIFTAVSSFISNVWNTIKSVFSTVLSAIVSVVTTYFNMYKAIITTVLNVVSGVVSSVWNSIKSFMTMVLNGIKSVVSSIWNSIKSTVSSVCSAIHSVVSSIWNSIKSAVSSVCSAIHSAVSSAWNSIKSSVSSICNSIKSTVTGIWNGIKSSISGIMDSIKSVCSGAWNKIKDIFSQVLKPNIKMPHINVSGKFSLNPPEAPHFGIDWYATGGIATAPTVVGIGEAGDEAILPLSNKSKMKPFAHAVASMMPDNVGQGESAGAGVNIQVGQLVVREEADIQRIAEQLYKLQERNKRARGKN